jgi:hypothetical protein
VDPVASLRPAEINVDVGEWSYTVPALNAADWIEVLAAGNTAAVIPGLLGADDQRSIMRDFLHGAITSKEIEDASHRVLEVAGGRKWWEVERLVHSALSEGSWAQVHGQLVLANVDLERLTLAGFVNAVWFMALQGVQKQADRDRLEWELTKPPPGYVDEMEETDEGDFQQILAEQRRLTAG